MIRIVLALLAFALALPVMAAQAFRFDSIDGGSLSLDQWHG